MRVTKSPAMINTSTHTALCLESRSPHDPGHFLNDWLGQSASNLYASMITMVDLHKHTGYGMEARFASHMPKLHRRHRNAYAAN
ncbi:hypothetical protein TNCV_2546301 [Trichonephila clavipes]|nr:hypothetical protein TNCV_2546301 [Trichonephila clavipes]